MPNDLFWMAAALNEATQAEAEGEVPVGAVVVYDEAIIGRGHNRPVQLSDTTAHAEILALREASLHLQNYRLPETTLYVTVEPCLMCMGALLHARVQRLVFGCYDAKSGAAGSLYNVASDERLNHQILVTAGIRGEEARALLQDFFRRRRKAQLRVED
ncbi:MAG: tRNA adenosine(34) deaminase TadA [Candidatus Binatia bacterium]